MKFWIFVLVFAISRQCGVKAIDSSSEKDYDSELGDGIDDVLDSESLFDERVWDSLFELDEDELSPEEEEEDELLRDEIKEYWWKEFQEDVERRTLITRVNNMLHRVEKDHGITETHTKNGTCSTFQGHRHTVHECKTIDTKFGGIMTCKVTCAAGYRLLHGFPHYELCGAATKWRWTYQLREKRKAVAKCVRGTSKKPLSKVCTTPGCIASAAYYINKIDFSVDPCDDFFEYSCGRWRKETPIPSDSRGMVETYSIVRKRVKKDMAGLLGQPIKETDIESVKKIKTAFEACMDTGLIKKLGSKPLLNILKDEIAWPVIDSSWDPATFDLEKTLSTLRGQYHNDILFKVKVADEGGQYMLQTLKGKMALPFSYYFGGKYSARKAAYFSLMEDVAVMLGADRQRAKTDMREVLEFESHIALLKVIDFDHFTMQTVSEMNYKIPGIDWLKLFKRMIAVHTITPNTLVNVRNVVYLRDMIKFVKASDKRVVQNYIVWRFVKHRLQNLSPEFQRRNLEFEKILYGKKKLHERSLYCAEYLDYTLKGPAGKLFLDKYFTPAKRRTARNMFENIRSAFIYLLDTEVEWMDRKTKEYAKEKALAIQPYIGYNKHIYENVTYLNEEWKELVIKKHDYFGNVLRILTGISQQDFEKLGKSDGHESSGRNTRPTMVNAFYDPSYNTMIMPAGELQYPFYWGNRYPRMFQYGGVGTILGHEITHGFDNIGSKHDKYGRLRNWWTDASLTQFHKRTGCIKDQYNNYYWKTAKGYLNGGYELAENIADNGGIRESYFGYQIWLNSKNLTGEDIEPATGLTNDQMFFLGFANVRCAKYNHRAAVHHIASSVHSPGRFRVIGSLQNFEKFSQAFHCPRNSYMNPDKKCIIW